MAMTRAALEILRQGQSANQLPGDAAELRLIKAWSHEFLHVAMMSAFVALGCNAMKRDQRTQMLIEIDANLPEEAAVDRAIRQGLLSLPIRYAASQFIIQDAYRLVASAVEAFEAIRAKFENAQPIKPVDLNDLAEIWQRAAQELNHALTIVDESGLLGAEKATSATLPLQGPERIGQLLKIAASGETMASSGMTGSAKGEMPNWVERRRWERQDSDMACTVTAMGVRHEARIRNVSLGGALIDGIPQLQRLTPVTVVTETGRTLTAAVMWWRDESIGIKFDQQLLYNDAMITPKSV